MTAVVGFLLAELGLFLFAHLTTDDPQEAKRTWLWINAACLALAMVLLGLRMMFGPLE